MVVLHDTGLRETKKPRKWNVSPGLVAPEWGWFYKGLKGCWPLWNKGSELEHSIVGDQPMTPDTGWTNSGWVDTPQGPGINPNAGNSQPWVVDETAHITGLTFGTWLYVIQTTASGSANLGLASSINGVNSASRAQFRFDDSGAEVDAWDFRSLIRIDGITRDRTFNAVPGVKNGDLAVLAYSYDGARERQWVNGQEATYAQTGTLESGTLRGQLVGSLSLTASTFTDPILMCAVWDRDLSSSELNRIFKDPFGPVRLFDQHPVAAPVVPGPPTQFLSW